ncbi:MAG TPA: hypothetical protein RMG48_03730 [Myxococcales bacterium LLY-WYZ-16_1]|jgi:hypothetical protein|nr:hypothetical protein [Myxococcales bacterium LLY-WYZ-16_1]
MTSARYPEVDPRPSRLWNLIRALVLSAVTFFIGVLAVGVAVLASLS